MPNIEIDMALFMPSLAVFWKYFNILKEHNFVDDILVINGGKNLRVIRKEELNLSG
jgi:hypothetical protein